MKRKPLMHLKTLWLITVRRKGNKKGKSEQRSIPARSLQWLWIKYCMKFGGREEIQLSGALQHYKQNHEVDMNVTGTKWICFDDRSNRIYPVGLTEETYINIRVCNSFKLVFVTWLIGGNEVKCNLLRRLLVMLAWSCGSGAAYIQIRGR